MKRKILALILAIAMIFTMSAVNLSAMAQTGDPMIVLESVEAETGDDVSVKVSIQNNPGVWGMDIKISYDKTALTLTSVDNGDFYQASEWTKGNLSADVYILSYEASGFDDITTASGTLATLNFKVSDTATPGDYTVTASYNAGDIINVSFDDIDFNIANGKIAIKAKPVPATGVSLDKETLSLDTGANNSATLTATVSPDACTNKAVTWKSSDESVATVNNGVVTALKHGTTTITVTTVDGGFTDVCVVTVTCAHTSKTPTVAKTANCQEGGWDAYYTCDGCGQLFATDGTTKISAIPTTGKNASNHTNIQPFAADTATCVHMGNNAYEKCVDCGVVTSGSDTKFYGDHKYGELKTAVDEKHTPDTLTPAVAAHYKCSVCNKYFTEAKVETTIQALTGTTPSHSYGNWVNTDADQHWKECGCGNKIEVNDHNYDNTCDTTCNTCGHVRTITHTWSNTWSTDGTNHWKECTVCHSARDEEGAHTGGTATCQAKKECSVCHLTYGDFAACDYIENHDAQYRVSEATCVAEAVYKKSCSVCGTAHATETFKYGTVNATNHIGGTYLVNQKEADCVNKGYTGDKMCNSCRTLVETGTDIPVGEHNPASVWSTDAENHWKDCQTVGCGNLIDKAPHSGGTATCKNKAICSVCNVEYGTTNAANHAGETEIKNAVEATCTTDGYSGDTYCKDCGMKIADGKTVEAGHKTVKVAEVPATHEKDGNIEYYTCSGCDKLFSDDKATAEIALADTVIAKGEHNYGDTYKNDADNHWKACGCGNVIEKAAHTFGEWSVTKEATETEKGSKEKVCSVCGYKVVKEIPVVKGDDTTDTDNDANTGTDVDNNGTTNDDIPEKSPQTGDTSNIFLWIAILSLSGLALVGTTVLKKKVR